MAVAVVGTEAVGAQLEARVYREAQAVAVAYGAEVGSAEWLDAVQGALDSLSDAEAEALQQYWESQQ